jgi:hypothetical protein
METLYSAVINFGAGQPREFSNAVTFSTSNLKADISFETSVYIHHTKGAGTPRRQ